MSFDDAIRFTEILIGFAFLLQSFEHLTLSKDARILFALRACFALLLLIGVVSPIASLGLAFVIALTLKVHNGPYNGGSDRLGALIIFMLCLVHWLPESQWREYAFGYLAIQLVLSYFISGWVKLVNPEWRGGQALGHVFSYSCYPACERFRGLSDRTVLLQAASAAVIGFELIFPLSLLYQETLVIALILAALFHLANAYLFGLTRFVWVWIAAYPSLLWLQGRLLGF